MPIGSAAASLIFLADRCCVGAACRLDRTAHLAIAPQGDRARAPSRSDKGSPALACLLQQLSKRLDRKDTDSITRDEWYRIARHSIPPIGHLISSTILGPSSVFCCKLLICRLASALVALDLVTEEQIDLIMYHFDQLDTHRRNSLRLEDLAVLQAHKHRT